MDDEGAAQLTRDLARVGEQLDEQAREMAELRAGFRLLVDILVARGDLTKNHPALIARVQSGAHRPEPPRATVHLDLYSDKYALEGGDIDCASLLHLCHGRCCTFTVPLTRQDLEEGQLKWHLDQPYLLRRERDGYCTHLERASGGCTVYDHRPGICRTYDCRADRRVWVDFERRIPAPMPIGVTPVR